MDESSNANMNLPRTKYFYHVISTHNILNSYVYSLPWNAGIDLFVQCNCDRFHYESVTRFCGRFLLLGHVASLSK